jgi:hypothetical protein
MGIDFHATRRLRTFAIAVTCGIALAGCAGPGDVAVTPSAPSVADKARAIQEDPNLTPAAKAIAAEKLTQSEVGNALAGGAPGQGK